MDTTFYSSFMTPGPEYRSVPFWAWNGKLDPEELRNQIRLFKEGGVGGVLIHSRYGLVTPYLSDEWFQDVGVCLEEAERNKLFAWIYDEDRWPSGSAGGMISKEHPEYRQHTLLYVVCQNGIVPPGLPMASAIPFRQGDRITERIWEEPALAAVFTAKIDDVTAADVRVLRRGDAICPGAGESVVLCVDVFDEPDGWHNNGTYIDPLNPAATRAFIEKTHEAYFTRFGGVFGGVIPGLFTDEPSYKNGIASYPVLLGKGEQYVSHRIAWTPALPDIFMAQFHFDIRDHLLELVYDVENAGTSSARYLFHELLTRLFVRNYIGELEKWCEGHGVESTGHVLAEDTPATQTDTVGSCMRCYEHMQRPGIDQLCETWRVYVPAKQLSSAARQFGKKWRLTETYGCTGWDFSFAGYKATGDYQAALGINVRVPHLAWYTMEGCAKRDYPGSIFRQATWWKHFHRLEDYFARIHMVMTRGVEVRDVLVIHSNESQWTLCRADWGLRSDADRLDHDFERLSTGLLARHLDFDYGDEEILSRIAAIYRDGQGRARLLVGEASYKAIVIPSVLTLRSTTFHLLERFRSAGGIVVFQGDLPHMIDGVEDADARTLAGAYPHIPDMDALAEHLSPALRRLSMADASTGEEFRSALYLLREDAENLYLFICNTGEEIDGGRYFDGVSMTVFDHYVRDRNAFCDDLVIRLDCDEAGSPVELSPLDGGHERIAAVKPDSGGIVFHTSLAPLQSRLYVIPKDNTIVAPPETARLAPLGTLSLPGPYRRQQTEPNVIVLDHPSYKIEGRDWQGETEILRIDRAVHDALGIEPEDAMGCQPWARSRPAVPRHIHIDLRYAFDVEAIPPDGVSLAIERPKDFSIILNGKDFSDADDEGWWVDPSLRRLKIPREGLVEGANSLRLSLEYDEGFPGLEIVYLLGAFDVSVRDGVAPLMRAPAGTIGIGDWCKQGLPFYSGNVSYSRPVAFHPAAGDRLILKPGAFRGTALRILVDGDEAAFLISPPFETDVTAFFQDGKEHELTLEVIGHRRNSHGPFHWNERWPNWQGPDKFLYDKDHWSDAYMLVPCGLLEEPSVTTMHPSESCSRSDPRTPWQTPSDKPGEH